MTPRRVRTPTQNPDFLWVNRTPDSDRLSATRQERDELRTITSHARTWRAAWRRRERLSSAQAQAGRAQSIVGWHGTAPTTQSETSSRESSAATSPASVVPTSNDEGATLAYLRTSGDSWWVQSALREATDTWLVSTLQGVEILDDYNGVSSAARNNTIDRIVQGCLQNTMHMFSLLAASTGFTRYVLKYRLERPDAPEYCNGRALVYLRQYLGLNEPRIDELIMFDLLALSTFERYVANFKGARIHLGMVKNSIEALGGLNNPDPLLMNLCYQADLLVAAGTGKPPLMPLIWDPGRLPPTQTASIRRNLEVHHFIPMGQMLCQFSNLHQSTITAAVGDFLQWLQLQQLALATDVDHSGQWSISRAYALAHRLLSYSTRDMDLPTASSSSSSSSASLSASATSTPPRLDNLSEVIRHGCLLTLSSIMHSKAQSTSSSTSTSTPASSASRHNLHHQHDRYKWYNLTHLRDALTVLAQQPAPTIIMQQHGEYILWAASLGAQLAGDRITYQAETAGTGPDSRDDTHTTSEDTTANDTETNTDNDNDNNNNNNNEDPNDDRAWFLNLASQIARMRSVSSLPQLENVLHRYAFTLRPGGVIDMHGLDAVVA